MARRVYFYADTAHDNDQEARKFIEEQLGRRRVVHHVEVQSVETVEGHDEPKQQKGD